MKKLISLMLCLCIVLAPVYVYAAEYPEETLTLMGDVNGDGKVLTSDARTALRMAAGLESKDGIKLLCADTDASGTITTADARNILRKAASLCNFSVGFDGAGVANALNALKSGRYTISAKAEDMDFVMAIDGEDIYLETSDISFSFGEQQWDNMAVMYIDDTFYVSFSIDGKHYAWQFTDAAIEMMFGSSGDASFNVDEIFAISDTISSLLPEKFDAPELTEMNGEAMFSYKTDGDIDSEFLINANGCLKQIRDYDSNGKLSYAIDIEGFSAEVSSSYFDLNRFDEIQLF